jgi:serine/threonine protein kinase
MPSPLIGFNCRREKQRCPKPQLSVFRPLHHDCWRNNALESIVNIPVLTMFGGRPPGHIFLRSTVDPAASAPVYDPPRSSNSSSPPPTSVSASSATTSGENDPRPRSEPLPYVWELKRVRVLGRGTYGIASLVEVVSPLPSWFPHDVLRSSPNGFGRRYGGRVARPQLVIKEIHLDTCPREDREALFREINILKAVQHPNIVRYIDSAIDPCKNLMQILMEFCDGGDMCCLIDAANRRSPTKGLSEPEVWSVFIQLLMALKCLHFEHRVIHRDLKPQNIFLTTQGILKVGDFGVSAVLAQTSDTARTFCGSPYYLAPEICEERPYNGKADLWALGVVLYELMAYGERPFKGDTLPALITDICTGVYTPIDEVVDCLQAGEYQKPDAVRTGFGPELRRIVGLLLQHDPDKRASIIRLLRLPAIHSRGCRLLPAELLCMAPYQEVFKHQHPPRAGHETPLAFGGTGTWTDLITSCHASPHFRAVGQRRTPSHQASRTALPTPVNKNGGGGTGLPFSNRNKAVMIASPVSARQAQLPVHGQAGGNGNRISANATLPTSPVSATRSPANLGAAGDTNRTAIFFPKESPMIPVFGIDGPSAAASPSGAERGMPAAAASPAGYQLDRESQGLHQVDVSSSDESEGPTPLKPAYSFVDRAGHHTRMREAADVPDRPDSDSDVCTVEPDEEKVSVEAREAEERVYQSWTLDPLRRGSIHFGPDGPSAYSVTPRNSDAPRAPKRMIMQSEVTAACDG